MRQEGNLLKFLTGWRGWAVVGVAVVVVGAVAYGAYAVIKRPTPVSVASSAQNCVGQRTKLVSLFSDGETTMIRYSNADYSQMQVLRTEPSNVLPGMFDALLALSGDNSRLAYVTADDELLNNAHLEYIDVTNPATRVDLATVSKGFWATRPAWSPDRTKLAFVELDSSAGPPGQFQLWMADTATQPATVGVQTDLASGLFTGGQSATICWTRDNRVVLIPSNPVNLVSSSPTAPLGTASPSASPKTGSPCGVPIFSQQDPAWRDAVMKSGTDSIGGAGCALTSTAMLLNYYGSSLTPSQLNTCLAGSADPLVWGAVPACTNGLIQGGDQIDFTWPDLDALLAAGRPAIVGMLRGQTGSHFVVVTSGGGGVADNYHITDPWDATTYKTLGSYINDGYTPAWIISYTGAGHNCARLIKGVVPPIPNLPPITQTPVTVNPPPGTKNWKFGIVKLSSGSIPKDIFNAPLTFTKLSPGATISDEGIYQVLATIQAPSNPPRFELYTFTIDKTPPVVDLTLLNPHASGDRLGWIGAGRSAMAPPRAYQLTENPAKLRVVSGDTLSGVKDIKFSPDSAALTEYSNNASFNRTLSIGGCGDHSIRLQVFDAAGNKNDVTKYFTVYCYVAPKPTPTPTHAPPPPTNPACTTPLTNVFVNARPTGTNSYTYTVTWGSGGGCPPVHGTITADVCGPFTPGILSCQDTFWTYTIPSQSGGPATTLTTKTCYGYNSPTSYFARFTLSMADSAGHSGGSVFGNTTNTPAPYCLIG